MTRMDAVKYISLLIATLALVTQALILVLMLYAPPLIRYRPLTATVLVGSAGLALWCVWDILRLEDARSQRSKDGGKRRADMLGCPDHYVANLARNTCEGGEVRLDTAHTGLQSVFKFDRHQVVLNDLKGRTYNDVCRKDAATSSEYPWTSLRSQCESVTAGGTTDE